MTVSMKKLTSAAVAILLCRMRPASILCGVAARLSLVHVGQVEPLPRHHELVGQDVVRRRRSAHVPHVPLGRRPASLSRPPLLVLQLLDPLHVLVQHLVIAAAAAVIGPGELDDGEVLLVAAKVPRGVEPPEQFLVVAARVAGLLRRRGSTDLLLVLMLLLLRILPILYFLLVAALQPLVVLVGP